MLLVETSKQSPTGGKGPWQSRISRLTWHPQSRGKCFFFDNPLFLCNPLGVVHAPQHRTAMLLGIFAPRGVPHGPPASCAPPQLNSSRPAASDRALFSSLTCCHCLVFFPASLLSFLWVKALSTDCLRSPFCSSSLRCCASFYKAALPFPGPASSSAFFSSLLQHCPVTPRRCPPFRSLLHRYHS